MSARRQAKDKGRPGQAVRPAFRHARGPGGAVPAAWRVEEAARQFGAGLVGLMQLADELSPVQRHYLMWALANSLERLLRNCALQPVSPAHRHAPRLADFIKRRAVVAPWPGKRRGWTGRKRAAAGRRGGRG